MSPAQVPPEDAAAALADVRARQHTVLSLRPFPGWYWPAIGALSVGLNAAIESRRPALIVTGTVLFAIGIATCVALALTGRRVQPRNRLLGWRGGLAIAGFAIGLVALDLAGGYALRTLHVPLPGTFATAALAVLMAFAGPALGRYLQRVMRAAAEV